MNKGLYFDIQREATFEAKVNDLELRTRDLKRDIAALQLAPTPSRSIDEALSLVQDYFAHIGKNTARNLSSASPPRRSRSRR